MAKIELKKLQGKRLSIFGSKARIKTDARVLVVGLGGTGTDALIRTKDAMLRRFDLSEYGGKIPSNISFLGIDTDKGVLDKFVGGAHIDPKREFVHLEDSHINIKFNNKKLLPDYINEWINPQLDPPNALGVGAAGVRQIGRYLLIHGYQDVVTKLTGAIQDMLILPGAASSTQQIILFSGISGGTGSGTFIDMGYIIQKVAENLKITSSTRLTAYLFLPDVNLANPSLPRSARTYIQCNGYAALKDLDYLMGMKDKASNNRDHELVKFHQTYGPRADEVIDTVEMPFNSVYLVSNLNDPQHPIKNGYEYALNIVSESVVNFVSQSTNIGEKTDMTADEVDINGAAIKGETRALNADGSPIMGNYCYKAIGAATAELPIEDVANYIAKKFFDKVNSLMERYPTAEEISRFIGNAKVDVSNAMNTIKSVTNSKLIVDQFQDRDFKSNPQQKHQFEKTLDQYGLKARSAVDSNLTPILNDMKAKIRSQMDIVFQNPQQGPFFANRLLTGYKNVPDYQDVTGLIDKVRGVINELSKKRDVARRDKENHTREAANAYKSGMDARFFYTDHFKTYKDHMVSACMKGIEEYTYDKLFNGYTTSILGFAMDLNTNIFNIYVRILEILKENFDALDVKISGTKMNTMEGREYRWQLVDIGDLQEDLDDMFGQADIDTILTNFLSDMIRESRVWLEDGEQIMGTIENFISNQFNVILGKSMDTILGNSFLANHMDQEIAQLAQNAEVHFPADKLIDFPALNISNSVSVPYNSPQILDKINMYIRDNNLSVTLTQSQLTDRILWLKVNIGIPVFLYLYLKDCEKEYESTGGLNRGMHLYESQKTDWRKLPSLVPEDIWGNTQGITLHTNSRVKKLHDQARELFGKASAARIIQEDDSWYYCCFTRLGAIDEMTREILGRYGIDSHDISCTQAGEHDVRNCAAEIKKMSDLLLEAGGSVMEGLGAYHYNFYRLKMGDTPAYVEHNAVNEFVSMPELTEQVRKELEARERLDGVLGKLDEILGAIQGERKDYEYFINGLVTGSIKIKGAFVYIDTVENPLCEITGETFPEYRMYSEYSHLNEVVSKDLRESIDGQMKKMRADTENMKKLSALYEARFQNLNRGTIHKIDTVIAQSTPAEVKTFYNRLSMFLQMMKTDIDSIIEMQTI